MEDEALLKNDTDIAPLVERAVEGVLLIFICILATGGNLALWTVVIREPTSHSSSNFLLLSLSAADLLVAVVNMPMTVYTIFMGRWMWTDGMCVATGFTNMFSFVASVLSLCMIALNRCTRVCRPELYNALYSPRATQLHITGVLSLSAALSAGPLLGWGEYVYMKKNSFCFCQWRSSMSYTIFMISFCFVGTIALMTGCYICIYRTFTRSKLLLSASRGSSLCINAPQDPSPALCRYKPCQDPPQVQHKQRLPEETDLSPNKAVTTCLAERKPTQGSLRSVAFTKPVRGRWRSHRNLRALLDGLSSVGDPKSARHKLRSQGDLRPARYTLVRTFGSTELVRERPQTVGEPAPVQDSLCSGGDPKLVQDISQSDGGRKLVRDELYSDRDPGLCVACPHAFRVDEPTEENSRPFVGRTPVGTGMQTVRNENAKFVDTGENVTFVDIKENITFFDNRRNATLVDNRENVTFVDIREDVMFDDARENVTFVDNKENVMSVDNREHSTFVVNRQNVTFVDNRANVAFDDNRENVIFDYNIENAFLVDNKKKTTSVDSRQNMTFVDNREDVTFIDTDENFTVFDTRENVTFGDKRENGAMFADTREDVTFHDTRENVTFGDKRENGAMFADTREDVTFHDARDNFTFVGNNGNVTFVDTRENFTFADTRNNVTFVDNRENVTFVDIREREDVTFDDAGGNVTFVDNKENVTFVDNREHSTFVVNRQNVTLVDNRTNVVFGDNRENVIFDNNIVNTFLVDNKAKATSVDNKENMKFVHNRENITSADTRDNFMFVDTRDNFMFVGNRENVTFVDKRENVTFADNGENVTFADRREENSSENEFHFATENIMSSVDIRETGTYADSREENSSENELHFGTENFAYSNDTSESKPTHNGVCSMKMKSDPNPVAGQTVERTTTRHVSLYSANQKPDPLTVDNGVFDLSFGHTAERIPLLWTPLGRTLRPTDETTRALDSVSQPPSSNSVVTARGCQMKAIGKNQNKMANDRFAMDRLSWRDTKPSEGPSGWGLSYNHFQSEVCLARKERVMGTEKRRSTSFLPSGHFAVLLCSLRGLLGVSPPTAKGANSGNNDRTDSVELRTCTQAHPKHELRCTEDDLNPILALQKRQQQQQKKKKKKKKTCRQTFASDLTQTLLEAHPACPSATCTSSTCCCDHCVRLKNRTTNPHKSSIFCQKLASEGRGSGDCSADCNIDEENQPMMEDCHSHHQPSKYKIDTQCETYPLAMPQATCNYGTSSVMSRISSDTSVNVPRVGSDTSVNVPQVGSNTSVNVPRVGSDTSVNVPRVGSDTSVNVPRVGSDTSVNVPRVGSNASLYVPPKVTTSSATPQATTSVATLQATTSVTTPQATTSLATLQATTSFAMPQVTTSLATPQVTTSMATLQATTSFATPQVTTSFATPQATTSMATPQVSSSTSLSTPRVNSNTSLSTPQGSTNASSACNRGRRRREEIRLTLTMLLVVMMFIISWLPYVLTILVNVFTGDSVPRQVDMMSLLMGYGNSFCNPIIYGWKNVNIRRGYLRLWRDLRRLPRACEPRRGRKPVIVISES